MLTFSHDPLAQPDERTNELNEAEKGTIQLVETREHAAKVLELVETAFDEMAFAIDPGELPADCQQTPI